MGDNGDVDEAACAMCGLAPCPACGSSAPTGAPPSRTNLLDTAFLDFLSQQGLSEWEGVLLGMGVKCREELSYIEEKDLRDAGMSLVEARKVLRYHAEQENMFEGGGSFGMRSWRTDGTAAEDVAVGRSFSASAPLNRLSLDGGGVPGKAKKRRGSQFWRMQTKRPLRLIFIRHGESEANVDRMITHTVPDHMLHLTINGRKQALEAGKRLRALVGNESFKFTVSPYVRTRETVNGILNAWSQDEKKDIKVSQDVRIREQEYGNFDSPDIRRLHEEKRTFGPFYYRFPHGESPADCYDRASMFFESLYRSWEDNEDETQIIVGHGMMILVTIMRLFRYNIEEFDRLDSLKNCEFVVLERPKDDAKYDIAYTWPLGEEKTIGSLRRKTGSAKHQAIWDGKPDAPMRYSETRRSGPRKSV